MRIKKLDIFVLKSFGFMFVGTFFICLFIFIMQLLWLYVDELVGKGIPMDVLMKFFYYAALTLVPKSLPLAILPCVRPSMELYLHFSLTMARSPGFGSMATDFLRALNTRFRCASGS